jgi:hypothetical protein
MSFFNQRYVLRIFNEISPFSNTFAQIEKQEIVNATLDHLRKMPLMVFNIFQLGSIVFTIFPFTRRLILISKADKLQSKLVNTILLLYISQKLPK